jgi:hypothetical protein
MKIILLNKINIQVILSLNKFNNLLNYYIFAKKI